MNSADSIYLKQATAAQYQTASNLEVRQAFNSLPKEDTRDSFQLFGHYYVDSGFLESQGDTLEVGGGNGLLWKVAGKIFIDTMANKGQIYVTDSSQGMVDACKKVDLLTRKEVILDTANVTQLKYEDRSFSRVIGNFMMYACNDAEKGVQEVARVLSDDGRAILVTMDETQHMIELYATLHKAKKLVEESGILIDVEFPQYAPAIASFCTGNAMGYLERSFRQISATRIANKILVHKTLPKPNESVSGPEFVVKYLQSLEFVQAAMKANKLPESFFKAIEGIVAEEIEQNGVFKISRCDVIYDCSQPIKLHSILSPAGDNIAQ